MSEPSEGVDQPAAGPRAGVDAPPPIDGEPRVSHAAAHGDGARPARSVPRPSTPGAPPRVPEIDDDDAALTERRPSSPQEDPSEGPPEIQRFLSPPPPPRTDSPSGGAEGSGAPRRRSRRTVKIPDDAVPQKTAPPLEIVDEQPAAPPTPPPAPERPALPVIPPSPPVPVLTARGSVPRPAARPADAPPPPVEMFEVIQPMRIISIGSAPPPPMMEAPPPVAIAAPLPARIDHAIAAMDGEPTLDQMDRRPSRPPLMASPELEAFASATPPPSAKPKPPRVEEVEAIVDEEPETPVVAAATLRTEELESIPDEEVEPDRHSDADIEALAPRAATTDEIPIDVIETPAPKKPPPPPPKRATSGEMPAVTPPSTPAPPAPATLSSPLAVAVAPGPPPAPPPPAAPAGAPLAQTLDLSGGRKRQKPWWEEIFSDDFLRTMEKVEPKAIRKECDFIEDRLGLEKGAVMLDLACGPGLHAVELSSRGYNVVGYDLSLAMLARAQDEALDRGQRINFLQGDVREMAFEEAFDGIYCWNTSFGYFDDEKNVNVLSRIHRGLRQGGLFLLDVANRDYVCPRQPSLVWFEGEGCVCMDEMHVDFFTSRLRVKRTVMFEDGRARECDYSIRLYALHELGKMLHEAGFKVVEVTGHPAHPGVFFGSESPRVIVLAERA